MPPKKDRKRYYPKRKKGKKKINYYKSAISRNIPNDKRVFRCKLEAMIPVTAIAGLDLQVIQMAFPLNFPTMRRIGNSGGGTYAQITGGGSAIGGVWQRLLGGAAIFDNYRVEAMRLVFIPSQQVNITSLQDYDANDKPNLMYVYEDPDDNLNVGSGVPGNLESAYMNRGVIPKSFTLGNRISYNMYQTKNNKSNWFNTAAFDTDFQVATPSGAGIVGTNINRSLKTAFLVRTDSGTLSRVIGRFYITWDCLFKTIDILN